MPKPKPHEHAVGAGELNLDELLVVPEAQELLKVGQTRFAELERTPGFPKAIWLGQRGKRYVRAELWQWALGRRAQ